MLEDGMENSWRNAVLSRISPLIYRFEGFELDPGKFELRADGEPRHVEPQVLSLLILLVANADRMVSKEEIVEKIWDGRIVSDAAIASRVKAARSALDDDGKQQRLVRTIHGRGFRFCGRVTYVGGAAPAPPGSEPPQEPAGDERPSIAVVPFRVLGDLGALAFVADALADELIVDLARLRWLLVIARASTFRFRGATLDCREVGAALDVRYCLSGTLEARAGDVVLSVELARISDNAVLWAERFSAGRDELQDLRHEILTTVIAKLESGILRNEVELARQMPATELRAWSAYHLGLDRMFRFNKADNARAAELFGQALARDRQFSRALSGLSFTSFQDSFLEYSDDSAAMAQRARRLAEEALYADPLDPFAHLNLGRSLWLDNEMAESLDRLSDCIALSPNYAQAIYSMAWAEMTQCDVGNSNRNAGLALRLSPLDPLRYAMIAVRSVNALIAGDYAAAADLGDRAARTPGAHKHIALIAAMGLRAAGDTDRAAQWVARARMLEPNLTETAFFRSFPFVRSAGRERIEQGLRDLRL